VVCHPSYGREKARPYLQNNQSMAHKVERLPSKLKALSLNHSTTTKRKELIDITQ
jgi:hypothetical protein